MGKAGGLRQQGACAQTCCCSVSPPDLSRSRDGVSSPLRMETRPETIREVTGPAVARGGFWALHDSPWIIRTAGSPCA